MEGEPFAIEELDLQSVTSEPRPVTVKKKWLTWSPFWMLVFYPVDNCPLTDIIPSGENPTSLDVSDLHYVFILRENIAKLLACCPVSHCGVDVLKNFRGITWSLSKECLDLLSDSNCFHFSSPFPPSHLTVTHGGSLHRLT